MSAQTTPPTSKRSFRRYRDGDAKVNSFREVIFKASHSHKCPTYIQSTPPCQGSCPAGEDIRGYLAIARGTEKPPADMPWQEYAWRRLTAANPFPSIMGRVCPAPCESGCNRNEVEDHVGINAVEHFLGEYGIEKQLSYTPAAQSTGKTVAVIGGGPAGLSCAYQLALKGHAVTIFDEHELLGGMMRYGIPGFRAPREVLDAEIDRILALGVKTRLNSRVGKDVTMAQIKNDFDAVFLGLGAQSGRALPIDNAQAPNVVTATAFLRAFNEGRLQYVGERVVVVGGGDTSVDVATVARRLGHVKTENPTDFEGAIGGHLAHNVIEISHRSGSDVTLTSVFPIAQMMANKHEIEQALAEGIHIMGGYAPIGIVKDDQQRATALRVQQCEAKLVGGKLQIDMLPGTEQDIVADLIVSAIGQGVDFTGLEEFDGGTGLVTTDKYYRTKTHENVFAGGDIIRPHLLTTAIGHGAIAADGIDAYLANTELKKRPKIDVHTFDLMRKMSEKGLEVKSAETPLRGSDGEVGVHNYENRSDRYVIPHNELFLGHFGQVDRLQRKVITLNKDSALGNLDERLEVLSEQEAQKEALRCMSCGMCFECDNCVVYCPQDAVKRVPKKSSTTGRYVYTDYNRCIGCHICQDVCPTGYIQMGLGE